jgi:hypothetical protein
MGRPAVVKDRMSENNGIAVIGKRDLFGVKGKLDGTEVGQDDLLEPASRENVQVLFSAPHHQHGLGRINAELLQISLYDGDDAGSVLEGTETMAFVQRPRHFRHLSPF